jgi:hypothetical protein
MESSAQIKARSAVEIRNPETALLPSVRRVEL